MTDTKAEGVTRASGAGVLYVVATPIGNLGDIGRRALEVLASVDCVLAEDTRHTARLLAHHGIDTPRLSLHDHNERQRVAGVAARVAGGESFALVCDAGTPLISDPGFQLVRTLRESGARVVPVPGPNAAVCALSVAGLPTDRFVFEGFLPARGGERRRRLGALASEVRTVVLYEAPHRVAGTLRELGEALGPERRAVVARELTKVFESVYTGVLGDLVQRFESGEAPAKGEFVILVAGAARAVEEVEEPWHESLLVALAAELPPRQAARIASRVTGRARNALYRRVLAMRGPDDHSP